MIFNPLAAIYATQGQRVLYPVTGTSGSLGPMSSQPTPTLFLSKLAPTCDEHQLLALGSPYGQVKSARFVMRPGEGKSFGFLAYGSVVEAQHALLGLVDGGFKVGYARETLKEKMERLSDPFETNVYVKNLPSDFSAQGLERLFAPSIIVSAKILENGRGGVPGKGVALVRLQTRDEAHSAVDALHGRLLPGCAGPLVVRFADSPAQKAVREEAARVKKQSSGGESSPESETFSWTGSSLATPVTQAATFPVVPPQANPYYSDLPPTLFSPYYPSFVPAPGSYIANAYATSHAQQQQHYSPNMSPTFNSYGGGGESLSSSAASSATSSSFGPNVGLGLMYPGGGEQQQQQGGKYGGGGGPGGMDQQQYGTVRW